MDMSFGPICALKAQSEQKIERMSNVNFLYLPNWLITNLFCNSYRILSHDSQSHLLMIRVCTYYNLSAVYRYVPTAIGLGGVRTKCERHVQIAVKCRIESMSKMIAFLNLFLCWSTRPKFAKMLDGDCEVQLWIVKDGAKLLFMDCLASENCHNLRLNLH